MNVYITESKLYEGVNLFLQQLGGKMGYKVGDRFTEDDKLTIASLFAVFLTDAGVKILYNVKEENSK